MPKRPATEVIDINRVDGEYELTLNNKTKLTSRKLVFVHHEEENRIEFAGVLYRDARTLANKRKLDRQLKKEAQQPV